MLTKNLWDKYCRDTLYVPKKYKLKYQHIIKETYNMFKKIKLQYI